MAAIDADSLYDYRSRRPTLRIDDGHLTSLEWPQLSVVHRRFESRDALILSGPEPDYRWQELSRELVMLAQDLGASEWITLGAIPAAVPHTRPVPVLGHRVGRRPAAGRRRAGSDRVDACSRGRGLGHRSGRRRRPASPTLGYFAQVPHYVSGEYPGRRRRPGPRRRAATSRPSVTTAVLELEARGIAARLDAAAAPDDSTKSYIARLEEMVDESRLPSGD